MKPTYKLHREILTVLLGWDGKVTVYDIAGLLHGERYGSIASRVRGRLNTLRSLGLAAADKDFTKYPPVNYWRITEAGRRALSEQGEATE